MIVVEWNPLVNRKFDLNGEFGLQDGFIKTLQFESGKKRTYLANSYVPTEFPSLRLALDNRTPTASGKTEYEEFENWFNNDLRYGTLPFSIVRIGWKRKWYTKTDELGIYKFLPTVPKFDRFDGIPLASFGLEEIGVIPEVEYKFLVTNDGKLITTNNGKIFAV